MHTNVHVSIQARGGGAKAAHSAAYRTGTTATQSVAYRVGMRGVDPQTGEIFDFRPRQFQVAHAEIIVGEQAPDWAKALAAESRFNIEAASQRFADLIDEVEIRKDAQLFREFIQTLPREFTIDQNVALVRESVEKLYASRGMMALVSMHLYGSKHEYDEPKPEGVPVFDERYDDPGLKPEGDHVYVRKSGFWYRYQPHAHVLTAMRPMLEEGFGAKRRQVINVDTGEVLRNTRQQKVDMPVTDWGSVTTLAEIQSEFTGLVRDRCLDLGFEVPLAYREEKEVILETLGRLPTSPLQMDEMRVAARWREGDIVTPAVQEHLDWLAASRKVIEQNPDAVIGSLALRKAVFTYDDVVLELRKFAHEASEMERWLAKVLRSDQLLEHIETQTNISFDAQGNQIEETSLKTYYTLRDTVKLEHSLLTASADLARRNDHAVAVTVEQVEARFREILTSDGNVSQIDAVHRLLTGGDLGLAEGWAGSGKTTAMRVLRSFYDETEFKVRGVALSHQAVNELRNGTGMEADTLRTLILQIENHQSLRRFLDLGEIDAKIWESFEWYQAKLPETHSAKDAFTEVLTTRQMSASTHRVLHSFMMRAAERLEEKLPTAKSIVVLDEAGIVGTKDHVILSNYLEAVGAKLIEIGDRGQTGPIDAGAPFAMLVDRFGAGRLDEITRQRVDWQRDASVKFHKGDILGALQDYSKQGRIILGQSVAATEKEPVTAEVLRYLEGRRMVAEARDVGASESLIRSLSKQMEQAAVTISSRQVLYRPTLQRLNVSVRSLAQDATAELNRLAGEPAARAQQKAIFDAFKLRKRGKDPQIDWRAGAKSALIAKWREALADRSPANMLILAYRNVDVDDLNQRARAAMRAEGRLSSDDVTVKTARGARDFAEGDRIILTDTDKQQDLYRRMRGTIREIEGSILHIQFDGQEITAPVDTRHWSNVDYGYASTVHSAQGMTADASFVLYDTRADQGWMRVAITRHRDDMYLFAASADAINLVSLQQKIGAMSVPNSTLEYEWQTPSVHGTDVPRHAPRPSLALDPDAPKLSKAAVDRAEGAAGAAVVGKVARALDSTRTGPSISDLLGPLSDQWTIVVNKIMPAATYDRATNSMLVGDISGSPGDSLKISWGSKTGHIIWNDFAAGLEGGNIFTLIADCKFGGDRKEAYKWALEFLGQKHEQTELQAYVAGQVQNDAAAEARKRAYAEQLWSNRMRVEGTAADAYLTSRQISARSDALGFVPKVKHPNGHYYPVLLVNLTDGANKFAGAHRIYLPDADGRKPEGTSKLVIGHSDGAVAKLSDTGSNILYLTEGIEDGLAIATARPNARVWAGYSASNLHQISFPDDAKLIVVCTDNDPAGEKAFERLQALHGNRVIRFLPEADMNDDLKAIGPTVLADRLANVASEGLRRLELDEAMRVERPEAAVQPVAPSADAAQIILPETAPAATAAEPILLPEPKAPAVAPSQQPEWLIEDKLAQVFNARPGRIDLEALSASDFDKLVAERAAMQSAPIPGIEQPALLQIVEADMYQKVEAFRRVLLDAEALPTRANIARLALVHRQLDTGLQGLSEAAALANEHDAQAQIAVQRARFTEAMQARTPIDAANSDVLRAVEERLKRTLGLGPQPATPAPAPGASAGRTLVRGPGPETQRGIDAALLLLKRSPALPAEEIEQQLKALGLDRLARHDVHAALKADERFLAFDVTPAQGAGTADQPQAKRILYYTLAETVQSEADALAVAVRLAASPAQAATEAQTAAAAALYEKSLGTAAGIDQLAVVDSVTRQGRIATLDTGAMRDVGRGLALLAAHDQTQGHRLIALSSTTVGAGELTRAGVTNAVTLPTFLREVALYTDIQRYEQTGERSDALTEQLQRRLARTETPADLERIFSDRATFQDNRLLEHTIAATKAYLEPRLPAAEDRIVVTNAHLLAAPRLAEIGKIAEERGASLVLMGTVDGLARSADGATFTGLHRILGNGVAVLHSADDLQHDVPRHALKGDMEAAVRAADAIGVPADLTGDPIVDRLRAYQQLSHHASAMAMADHIRLEKAGLGVNPGRKISDVTVEKMKERNALAAEIVKDIDSYRDYLSRSPIDPYKLALHAETHNTPSRTPREHLEEAASNRAAVWTIEKSEQIDPLFDTKRELYREAGRAWSERLADLDGARLIIAPNRAAAGDINLAARADLKALGQLGDEVMVPQGEITRALAVGDRILFKAHAKRDGIAAGDFARVEAIDGPLVAFKEESSGRIGVFDATKHTGWDYGYALGAGEANALRLDHTIVLLGYGVDRETASGQLSRAAKSTTILYAKQEVPNEATLQLLAERKGDKVSTLLYSELDPHRPQVGQSLLEAMRQIRAGQGHALTSDGERAVGDMRAQQQRIVDAARAMSSRQATTDQGQWAARAQQFAERRTPAQDKDLHAAVASALERYRKAGEKARSLQMKDTPELMLARRGVLNSLKNLPKTALQSAVTRATMVIATKIEPDTAKVRQLALGSMKLATGVATGNPLQILSGIYSIGSGGLHFGTGGAIETNKREQERERQRDGGMER